MWLRSKKEFMKKFGKRVKMFRLLTNLTREQLAEKCDCSAQTISGIETGYSFPSSNILFKLAEILEVSPAEFFKFEADNLTSCLIKAYDEGSIKL